jgi:hypothetical protein
LLRIAECNLYRPLWSQRIIDEAVSALHRVHPEVSVPQFIDRFDQMNAAFEDALVVGWESLEHDLVLPDRNDRHVLAAAIRGSAGIIVTNNTRDFPAAALQEFDIEVTDADAFLLDQLDLAPQVVATVIREQAGDTRNPILSPDDLLQSPPSSQPAELRRRGPPSALEVMVPNLEPPDKGSWGGRRGMATRGR